ncbi:VCBS repeat-containing protein [Verrucomicrobiaceae bacterium 227]
MSFSCQSDESTAEVEVEVSIDERIEELVAVEELILELTPSLKRLNVSVTAGVLPDASSKKALFSKVEGRELVPSKAVAESLIETVAWSPGNESRASLWEELFGTLASVESARFYLIDGSFPHGLKGDFDSIVGFEGKATDNEGRVVSITGKQHLIWRRSEGDWRIVKWIQSPLEVKKSPREFFREVLDEALPDRAQLQLARHSQHERNIVDLFTKDKFTLTKQVYADYLDLDSTFQHPGLSAVDYNQDGWDDLYVMGRWGKNQMLRNNQDGTFTDVAGEIGLDIDGLCTSAIFADFDNDGDPDVFIGRSLERSLYLRNDNGRFVSQSVGAGGTSDLPYLVSTISAVDYDNDGLLDVYLGLYAPPSKSGEVSIWAKQFFPPGLATEIMKRGKITHKYLNRFGPPNLLLKNMGGGKFTISPAADDLAEWLDTYAAIWSDFDQDGDADVYVCNDFGPDHLYRNDNARFVDVTREFAGDQMQGFGMGASWGDYDRDGRLDLYVSNMFSKAGRRITDSLDELDPRVPHSANGNLLFKNNGPDFTQVAGTSKNTLAVAKVGWAYGAQFVDIDNDGWLDIYSASGFYSAPKEIANNKDL